MHTRHEPNLTSAKQQMKGTLWGGEPRGAPHSRSQLDTVHTRPWNGLCKMLLVRGCQQTKGLEMLHWCHAAVTTQASHRQGVKHSLWAHL